MAEKRKRPAKKATPKKKTAKKPVKKAHNKAEPKTPVFEIKKSHHVAEPELTQLQRIFAGLCVAMVALFGLSLSDNIYALNHWQSGSTSDVISHIRSLGTQFQLVKQDALTLEQGQSGSGIEVVPSGVVDGRLSDIQTDIELHNKHAARAKILGLSQDLSRWQNQLNSQIAARQSIQSGESIQVPILLYHYTPADFDDQLSLLSQKGYHVVTLDDLAAAFRHQITLPPKPAIITFDDGFENQMIAFDILKKHSMKATYYIIDGGEQSQWCIGANRHHSSCGDSYLSWDQVRELDHSGLITIGSHTVDHANLPTETIEEQRYEIFEGKSQLEAEIGHKVYHFAYPYGTFNAATIALVEQAGFTTAVTTQPGDIQTPGSIFTLRRVREIRALP